MLLICPDCGTNEEIKESDFIYHKDWHVKNTHKTLQYVKKCNCCKIPIYINTKDYEDIWSTNTLISSYEKECLYHYTGF